MAAVQGFASAPQAVGTRQKYRDPMDRTNNMMYDKRIARGNTYASVVEPQHKQPEASEVQRRREAQRRRLGRANQTKKRAGTPEPVYGRKHMDIQTDSYLEELTERTVEFEAETQTDFLLDRPPSPLFMPAKIGVDVDTQIEEGELFDFDIECEPVLEVLVGKTLEQGMMEVLEEEELESLRRHQEEFEKRRNAELLEVQRMEAAEKRRHDEMERRMRQQAAQREKNLSVMRKVVSRTVAAAHLSSLKDRALAHLLDANVFMDAARQGVEEKFMTSLIASVVEQASKDRSHSQTASSSCCRGGQARPAAAGPELRDMRVSDVMNSAVTKKVSAHANKLEMERERIRVIDTAEKKARAEKMEEKRIQEEEKKRIEEEQARMEEWENTQPPEPKVWDAEVGALELEPAPEVTFKGDDRVATLAEDQIPVLQELLSTDLQEGERIMATIEESLETGALFAKNFRVEKPE
eukprot:TRINITY_DN17174_c0_g3_i2.p1 TRINITY_DN17174_c0_g3~~TRINITY_DN17174_c0_g3_i2.p1  ORF type:complete len:466 (+),score=123.12 TRINITY_DN17174_c0_g3_i2:119-1516(+)